jgi:hypothetical protein
MKTAKEEAKAIPWVTNKGDAEKIVRPVPPETWKQRWAARNKLMEMLGDEGSE